MVSESSGDEQHDAGSRFATQNELFERQTRRAAKAVERREKSEALRKEGNSFFCKGDYQSAVDRYQEAIRVHGRSVKPVLLTNLAIAYYNLGKFCEANEAAEKALEGDPKSVKARYRRAMARKNMEMWRAAAIDFRIVLRLDPRYYKEVKNELAYVEKCHRENCFLDEEDTNNDSDYELPGPDEDPDLGESLSESSDCEHAGNGKPCKLYNHTGCTKGRACPFSHAPDYQSVRDALGRNVCRYYLMDLCRFGDRCNYSHSKEFLLQRGWWSTAEEIDKAKKIYEVQQKFQKAFVDYEKKNESFLSPDTEPASKKTRSRGKKNSARRADVARAAASGRDQYAHVEPGPSSMPTNSNNQTMYKANVSSTPEHSDSDGGDEEYGMFGFTNSEVEELLCHGIKPWDDIGEARNFLKALHARRRMYHV